MNRSTLLWSVTAIVLSAVGGFAVAASMAPPPAPSVRVVRVSARRYEFTPAAITIRLGESVDLELVTGDVVMGFNAPDLGVRSTLVPGEVEHLLVTPQKTGTFPFLCDVFCGSGHEEMNGVVTVVD